MVLTQGSTLTPYQYRFIPILFCIVEIENHLLQVNEISKIIKKHLH